jgi:hypothetical protein
MFKVHRLIATAAVAGALAVAGPVAGASAAGTGTAVTSGSSIPCYPFPAFCNPSNGQPAAWAPWWVRPALGLPATPVWPTAPVWPLA